MALSSFFDAPCLLRRNHRPFYFNFSTPFCFVMFDWPRSEEEELTGLMTSTKLSVLVHCFMFILSKDSAGIYFIFL